MPKLILKFEAAVLKEVVVGARPVTIGRAPDNDIQIDNLAVSSHHARVLLNILFLAEFRLSSSEVQRVLRSWLFLARRA